jgi:hypothetical protein
MLKPGHAAAIPPEAFGQAIDAFLAWESGEPEPTVECKGRQLPISQICGLLSNCSDVIPSNHFNTLSGECDLEIEGRTYQACGRAMLVEIEATVEYERLLNAR